jgi:hypothetical protein
MASSPTPTLTSLRDWLAQHPLRLAFLLVAAFVLAAAMWVASGGEANRALETTWYGDNFNARGFERRTLGRALTLPTREAGAQRAPSIAIVENLALPAEQIPILEAGFLDRDAGHRIALIWRNSVQPTITQRLELEPGVALTENVRMASHPGWRGTISGIGIAAGHTSNVPLNLKYIAAQSGSTAQRFDALTRPFQTALSRPSVGEEHSAKARRLWLAPWLGAAVALALGLFAWGGQRFVAPRPLWVAVGIAAASILIISELTHRVAVANTAVSNTRIRSGTLNALSAALKAAPKSAALHVWSGDSRGYELALASAPRVVNVTLKDELIPNTQPVATGDVIVILGRRGVRFDPTRDSLDWGTGTSARVALMGSGEGDAVFAVVSAAASAPTTAGAR